MAKKKKPRSPALPAPAQRPPGTFMKPEWRRKVYGEGGPREIPPRTSAEAERRTAQAARSKMPPWMLPFEHLRPSPEEEEGRRKRSARAASAEIAREEREYVEAMRRQGVEPSPFEAERRGAPPQARPGETFRREGGGLPPPGPRPGAPPPSGYRPPPSGYRAPGGAPPPSGYRPPPGASPPPGGRPAASPLENPLGVFNLPSLWEGIRMNRTDPRFKGAYGVGQLSGEGRTQAERALDVARFFRIPEEVLRQYRPESLWVEWAEPFLRMVENELNTAKPSDIPGRLKFDLATNGQFGLVYVE